MIVAKRQTGPVRRARYADCGPGPQCPVAHQGRCSRRPWPLPPNGRQAPGGPMPAYILLEVIFSLALLVLGLATIGGQVQTSFDTAYETQRMLRAMHLAESKLAELNAQLIPNIEEALEDYLEEEFGRLFPDWAWRLRIDPTQTDDLWLVRIDILYQERQDVDEEEFDFDEDEIDIAYTLRTLRATPATIDPTRDFGTDEETMERLAEALGGTDLDVGNLDPRLLAGLPIEDLVGLVAAMQEAGLLQGIDLASILPPEIMQMIEDAAGGDMGTDGPPQETGGRQ